MTGYCNRSQPTRVAGATTPNTKGKMWIAMAVSLSRADSAAGAGLR
jgi:hypothetical protein